MSNIFATAINCIDGRIQVPIIEYMKRLYKVDHVDVISEPGVNKVLSDVSNIGAIEALREKVEISVLRHYSRIITISGHYDCAANPSGENEHKKQLLKAVNTVKNWDLPVDIIQPLWVNEKFNIVEVSIDS